MDALVEDEDEEVMHDSDDDFIAEIAFEGSAPTVACRTLYKARKYDWKTKTNLHVHIIEHLKFDTLELVAFDTNSLVEAPRVYLRTSSVAQRVESEGVASDALVEEVRKEFDKANMLLPLVSEIENVLTRNAIVEFLLTRMVVSGQPSFTVDVKDVPGAGVGAGVGAAGAAGPRPSKISSASENGSGFGSSGFGSGSVKNVSFKGHKPSMISSGVKRGEVKEEVEVKVSRILRLRPKSMDRAKITRYGKSATLVGDVSGVRVSKEQKLLLKAVTTLHDLAVAAVVSASKQAVITRLATVKRKVKVKGNGKHFVTFAKFRTDLDLLVESLSFMHISDYLLMQLVCRTWNSVLSGALKSMSHMSVTSRDYYNREMRRIKPSPGQLGQMPRWVRRRVRSRWGVGGGGWGGDEEEDEEEEEGFSWKNADHRFKWRDIYVDCDTVKRVVFGYSVQTRYSLTSLHLHYVVLNADIINNLSRLSGRLKKLTLGVIKVLYTYILIYYAICHTLFLCYCLFMSFYVFYVFLS
jgi:hypothetical protein